MIAGRKRRARPNRVRNGLLERLPPTERRTAAFDKAQIELAHATEKFEHQGDGGRLGAFLALDAVFRYFTSRGVPPATLEPLMALSAAIVDAERGTENPIFKPKRLKRGGKPKKRVGQLYFEGYLATVMECCVQHCKLMGAKPYIEPAGVLATKMVNDSQWPVKVTSTQLREIRERVQQSEKHSPDRLLFEECCSSPIARAMPLEWAKLLLRHEWVNPPPAEVSA